MLKNIEALCLGYINFKVEVQAHFSTPNRVVSFLSYESANDYVKIFEGCDAYINFTGYNPIKRLVDVYIKRERDKDFDGWYSFYLKPFPVAQQAVVEDTEPVVMQMDARR